MNGLQNQTTTYRFVRLHYNCVFQITVSGSPVMWKSTLRQEQHPSILTERHSQEWKDRKTPRPKQRYLNNIVYWTNEKMQQKAEGKSWGWVNILGIVYKTSGKTIPIWILYCTTLVCCASLSVSLPQQPFLLKMWLQVTPNKWAQGMMVPRANTFLFC